MLQNTIARKRTLIALIMIIGLSVLAAIGLQGERYAISGIENYQRGNYSAAITDFLAADKAAAGKVPSYHFWLGRLYIAKGELSSARQWINRYLQSADDQFRSEANSYLKIMNRQDRIFEKVSMGDLPSYIMSRNSDYGAVVSPDGQNLYYTSLSPTRNEKENIWRSERLATGWGRPYPVVELNTDKNEAIGSFSQDGKTAYISGNYKRGQIDGDIYSSTLMGNKWSPPVAIPAVNSIEVEAHPFVYQDSLMFFTSSREGGFGKFDIWVSEFKSGDWGEPINLGSTINTAGNEQTPFLDYDGRTLFFASDTHPGFGGFDLFKAVKTGNTWQDWSIPENLGLPVNSIRNERYFYHLPESNEAMITSDRKADGFEKLIALNLVFAAPPSYIVKDEASGEELTVVISPKGDFAEGSPEGIEVTQTTPRPDYIQGSGKLTDDKGKPLSGELRFSGEVNGGSYVDIARADENGDYTISLPKADRYTVIVNKEGYLLHSEKIYPDDSGAFTLNIKLKQLEAQKVFAFQNIQFNFDSAVLKKESFAILDEIVVTMLNNPTLELEISGHTCNIGRDSYNMELSKRRANSVYDYLLQKGIEANRLSHTGFGEEKPLNQNATTEERIMNRRVEFKVIK